MAIMWQALSSNMTPLKPLLITFIVGAILPICRGQDDAKRAAPMNECAPKMSESECDRKIQRDLASAIRSKAKECSFEPDWRPTNLKDSTLHVSGIDRTTILVAIDGKNYTLQADDYRNSACQEMAARDCSRWKPEVGMDYSAVITNKPKYLNDCLHKELPAKREVCIGFGKMKQETLPHGVSRTPEFEVCYSVPAN